MPPRNAVFRSTAVLVILAAQSRRKFDLPRRQIGYPQSIRVDQGSEFISRDLDL
jgi:hypothetical protein